MIQWTNGELFTQQPDKGQSVWQTPLIQTIHNQPTTHENKNKTKTYRANPGTNQKPAGLPTDRDNRDSFLFREDI